MTRPDDEFPPLDVTSTLNLGALDDVLEGPDAEVAPGRMSGSLPPGMALLVVRRGPNAGARFLLDHDVTTSGRHPDSDIFLDDVTVSRRHAEFHREGGTFTVRDGFEANVPQWHWRHDQRPKLPKDVQRTCFSYWQEGPLLNPVIMRVLWELSGNAHRHFITDTEDLGFLEYGFSRRDIARWGALVELMKPDMPVAADLLTDGGFFGGLLVARDLPPGFEVGRMPKRDFHDAAIRAFPRCDFYARRLYDDEFSWFSGEYEVVSPSPLDVRGVLSKIATEIGAQVMEIDRRFHKRIVVPLGY